MAQIFSEMEKAFQPDAAAGIDAVFQCKISGDSGGDWNITVKDQMCKIKEGQVESPTTTLQVSFEDFVAMLTPQHRRYAKCNLFPSDSHFILTTRS